jgi:hypothetical protein
MGGLGPRRAVSGPLAVEPTPSDAHRQDQQAGAQRRLVPRLLQEQRQADQRAVDAQVEQQAHPGRRAEVPGPEEPKRQHRSSLPVLGQREQHPGAHASGEQGIRHGGEPALLACGDEARGEPREGTDPQQQAPHVDAA